MLQSRVTLKNQGLHFLIYRGKDTKNFTKGFFTRKPFMASKVGIYRGDEHVAFWCREALQVRVR